MKRGRFGTKKTSGEIGRDPASAEFYVCEDSEFLTREPVQKGTEGAHGGIRHRILGSGDVYLVYLNNREPENESLKTMDLCDQKTAP